MNKHKLTELEFLNEKIKNEKQRVYSKGLVLLPGIATITCGALASDRFGAAVGSVLVIAGLALTAESLVQFEEFQANQESKVEKVYEKVNNITRKNK